ncbi:hypothetical protein, partial [Verrucomicrobium sp. BvORR034]|uniref:hypothetical protein n=1 Tax=Verrucomicrobium sp. BvORR034 TaxID=1396418 RepID=UPI002240FAD9
MSTLYELPNAHQEIMDIVCDTIRNLWAGSITLSHAQAIFTGAKVYTVLDARLNDRPPDQAAMQLPMMSHDFQDFEKLLALMELGRPYSPGELQQLAEQAKLFPNWLTSMRLSPPSARARFGLMCAKAHGRSCER